jgi:hypothetical protein
MTPTICLQSPDAGLVHRAAVGRRHRTERRVAERLGLAPQGTTLQIDASRTSRTR